MIIYSIKILATCVVDWMVGLQIEQQEAQERESVHVYIRIICPSGEAVRSVVAGGEDSHAPLLSSTPAGVASRLTMACKRRGCTEKTRLAMLQVQECLDAQSNESVSLSEQGCCLNRAEALLTMCAIEYDKGRLSRLLLRVGVLIAAMGCLAALWSIMATLLIDSNQC
jgi:hypothetical protein